MRQDAKLLRVSDDQLVAAVLTTLTQKHLDDFETFWKSRLQTSAEEDSYWNWETKNRLYLERDNYEGYAIECDQITQGLMLLETQNHRSWFESNRRVVYVQILETAPWNRRSLQRVPTYKLVGSKLLSFAKQRSQELGYAGLVGLHALPRAKKFYQLMEMIDCGEDEEKENLTYFEWYKRLEINNDTRT